MPDQPHNSTKNMNPTADQRGFGRAFQIYSAITQAAQRGAVMAARPDVRDLRLTRR